MYEKPKLVQVGEIADVVLGISLSGDEMDGTRVIQDFEYAIENDTDE